MSFRHAKCRYVVHSWLANALEIGHAPVEARNDPASPQSSSRLIGRSSETHHRSEGPHATHPRPEYGRARTAYGASLANWGYADWTLQPSVFSTGAANFAAHTTTPGPVLGPARLMANGSGASARTGMVLSSGRSSVCGGSPIERGSGGQRWRRSRVSKITTCCLNTPRYIVTPGALRARLLLVEPGTGSSRRSA